MKQRKAKTSKLLLLISKLVLGVQWTDHDQTTFKRPALCLELDIMKNNQGGTNKGLSSLHRK